MFKYYLVDMEKMVQELIFKMIVVLASEIIFIHLLGYLALNLLQYVLKMKNVSMEIARIY
jgi:hypothetical protein